MKTSSISSSKPLATIQQQHPPQGLEQSSKPSFSCSTPENRRKKRCRVCRQSSIKQLKSSTELTLPPDEETQNPTKDNNISLLQHNQQLYHLTPTTFHFGNVGPNKGLGFTDKAINNSSERIIVEKEKPIRNISEFKRNNPYDVACSLKNANAEVTGVVVQSGGGDKRCNAEIVAAEAAASHTTSDQEASDAIELIESCILALQQVVALAKQVEPREPQLGLRRGANSILLTAEPTNLESREIKFPLPNNSMNGGALLQPPLSNSAIRRKVEEKHVGGFRFSSDYDMLNQSVAGGQNVKAILEKIESLRWVVASQNDYMPSQNKGSAASFVQGLEISPLPDIILPNKKKMGEVTSQPAVSSVGSTGPDTRIGPSDSAMITRRGKRLPGQTHTRLDHKFNEGGRTSPISYEHHHHQAADQVLGLAHKKISRVVGPRRVILTESTDGTDSSLPTSSGGWTSQGVSVSSRGSEECSLTGQTPSQHYRSLSICSESDVCFLPAGEARGRSYAGPTSSSTDESVPSTTRAKQVGLTSSSESQGYLPSGQASTHCHVYRTAGSGSSSSSSTSRRGIGPIRKNGNWTKPEKQMGGRLRKLKDKLAIVFHHHHHHHHHHHDDKGCGGTSLFKNKKSKDEEAYRREQQAVEKVRKSVVGGKKQEGHLRSLVEGLLNHLRRHSKKSKLPKVRMRQQLEKGQHTVVKNLHWWQMLRRQRGGGMKVPKKQQQLPPKLGLSTKRQPHVKHGY